MSEPLRTGAIHHVRLTVNDVDRSRAFYMHTLGFTVVIELAPGTLLTNGTVLLGLAAPPDKRALPSRTVSMRIALGSTISH